MRGTRIRGSIVRVAAVTACVAVLLAGCGDDGDTADSPPTTAPAADATTTAPPTTGAPEPPTTTTSPPTTTAADPAVPLAVEVVDDVAYTSERALDIYAPAEGSGWPVVVYFHGGFPAPGRRAQDEARHRAIAERGVVVYAPDWRSGGPIGGSEDTLCAVAYAEATAGDHGGDAAALTLAGYSTGGFTALVHGLVGDDAPLPVTDCMVTAPTSTPAAGIAVGGVPVFAAEWARDGRLPSPAWTGLTPDQLDLYDPYLLLGRNPDVIVALVVGDNDVGGPAAPPGGWPITEAMFDYDLQLVGAGYDAGLGVIPGGHVLEPGSDRDEAFVEAIVATAAATAAS